MIAMGARRPLALVSAVWLTLGACTSPHVRPVPVAEADAHGIGLDRARQLVPGTRADAVIALLGEPADRAPSCVPGEVAWRYPIRAWNDVAATREIVPAVLLRMTFDRAGTLADWSFVDPATGRSLSIAETPDAASRWFDALSRAPAPIPPRIGLDEALVRGRTTQQDVERALGRWRPELHCTWGGVVPVVRKSTVDSGSVWEWYVDRPSPLFIPPRYLVTSFHGDTLSAWHLEQTYPGGRE